MRGDCSAAKEYRLVDGAFHAVQVCLIGTEDHIGSRRVYGVIVIQNASLFGRSVIVSSDENAHVVVASRSVLGVCKVGEVFLL